MKSLQETLIEQCKSLNIYCDIDKERIRLDLDECRVFGTTNTHWEYCVIPDISADRSIKYSFTRERNDSIRLMIEAIASIRTLTDGEQCAEADDCEWCS